MRLYIPLLLIILLLTLSGILFLSAGAWAYCRRKVEGGILIWDFAVYDGESIWLHANLAFMVVSSIG